jgi:hypothetical protein
MEPGVSPGIPRIPTIPAKRMPVRIYAPPGIETPVVSPQISSVKTSVGIRIIVNQYRHAGREEGVVIRHIHIKRIEKLKSV